MLEQQGGDPGAPVGSDERIPDDSPQNLALSEAAERFLEDVVEHPFTPLSERYERYSSDYKGNKAKNELVEAELLVEHVVRTEGAIQKLLELAEQGRSYVETSLELNANQRGRGGIVHRFWQYRLQDRIEMTGWPAKLELCDADVYANLEATELVVEVAMRDIDRVVEHVQQHLEDGFDVVRVVCRDETVRESLRQRLQGNDALDECVTLQLFHDLCGDEVRAI